MDQYSAVLVAPGHVPDEVGGSYNDACRTLELGGAPDGYVLYLLDLGNMRSTVISTDTQPIRDALADLSPGMRLVCDRLTVLEVFRRGIVEDRPGWPEEFGGGPRCQFCRIPEPTWVYEGADVDVLLRRDSPVGEPFLEVAGTEVTGVIDWHACQTCREVIDARTSAAWHDLLDRFGGDHVPMAVQAAWREFWGNHRRATPAPPPAWTPGRRRLVANQIRATWDAFHAEHRIEDVRFTSDAAIPELAGVDAVLADAHDYLQRPPPEGRVRRYSADPEGGWIVRADGDTWTLLGQTDRHALVLTDGGPEICPVRGPGTNDLIDGLANLADS
ncbi:MAG: hypothetical protein GEV11_00360 [Streptosporangiales bacterium]|nr:hypothetical protein [Streptosporangiales bacterium]